MAVSTTKRLPAGTVVKEHVPRLFADIGVSPWQVVIKGCRAGLSASRMSRGMGLPEPSTALATLTPPPAAKLTTGVPTRLTLGVPKIPTFQAPLCWAFSVGTLLITTVPDIDEVPTRVVGTGLALVFMTVTVGPGGMKRGLRIAVFIFYMQCMDSGPC